MTQTIDAPVLRDLPTELAELEREYLAKWRTWAYALAAGKGARPSAREVLDAGLALGYECPADRLRKDAAIIASEAELVSKLKAANKAVADFNKQHGATESIAERVAAAEKELERLQGILHQSQWLPVFHSVAGIERDLKDLRSENEHLLGEPR